MYTFNKCFQVYHIWDHASYIATTTSFPSLALSPVIYQASVNKKMFISVWSSLTFSPANVTWGPALF